MSNLFNMDNPFWRTMGKLVDVAWLNILWLVCSIPIVTIGPSTTALYYVMLKLVRDEDSHNTKSFFRSFKQNFKQGVIIWIIMAAVFFFFVMDIRAYRSFQNNIATVLSFLFIGLLIVYILVMNYVFPVLSKFDNTIRRTIQNAFIMSIRHIGWSLLMSVVFIGIMLVLIWIFPPLMILGYGLVAFINSFILAHIFDKYIPKEEEHENEDMFMTNREIEAQEEAERTGEAVKDPFAESVAILKGEESAQETESEDSEGAAGDENEEAQEGGSSEEEDETEPDAGEDEEEK
ncbi:MAG: YesL family protein [Lachnospiraceae bacterium]|nr:DUF624 domain-containing protein [Candidatus Fimimorpha excrementavium]